MKINQQKFIEEYQLRSFGAKGWKQSELIDCPFCGGRYDKFGVLLLEEGGVFNCFRCEKKGSLFQLLTKLRRLDLVLDRENDNFTYQDKLESFLKLGDLEEKDLTIKPVKGPLGFRTINFDPYLESRGWREKDYSKFNVGISKIEQRFKEKILFLLKEEGEVVGYLARSKKSKEWHKNNLKKSKLGLEPLVLRYDNSKDTEFERVVGGIDDIVEGETKTVIVVEGIMDKQNTDKVLQLDSSPEIRCVFMFGCHLSDVQMYKLLKRGVENVILMFDKETIQQTKDSSLKMLRFFNIFISELKEDTDPGEMSLEEFDSALSKLIDPLDFFVNRINKVSLK